MTSRASFGYAGMSIDITCPEPSLLRWLGEFLAPAFEVGAETSCDFRIEVRLDPAEYRRTLERSPTADPENLEWFSLDGHFESHPRWVSEGDILVSHDRKRQAFYSA